MESSLRSLWSLWFNLNVILRGAADNGSAAIVPDWLPVATRTGARGKEAA